MAQLLSMRLAAAREMLRAAGRERSISRIALRCGFTHLGRFSVNYRHAFGETPPPDAEPPGRIAPTAFE
jgi:transcriptional regulator GlxA family with amidase domain